MKIAQFLRKWFGLRTSINAVVERRLKREMKYQKWSKNNNKPSHDPISEKI